MPAWATNMVALPFASSFPNERFAPCCGEREHATRSGRHVAGQPPRALNAKEILKPMKHRNAGKTFKRLCPCCRRRTGLKAGLNESLISSPATA